MEDQLLNMKLLCFEFHTLNNVVGGRGGGGGTSISKFLTLGIHHCFNMQLSMICGLFGVINAIMID